MKTLADIMSPEMVDEFLAGHLEIDGQLFEDLFDYYCNTGEMPYGVAKARSGDPYEWIELQLVVDLCPKVLN